MNCLVLVRLVRTRLPQYYSIMASSDISGMRKPYKGQSDIFDFDHLVAKEPFKQFGHWFDVACKTEGILEANAMALATASRDGMPSVRMVLLKGYDESGFVFYTNYESRKGKELKDNPLASLMFYWEPLLRSVRIEGHVEKLADEENTKYFHSRPRSSQIGACVTHQSTVIKNRQVLDEKNEELQAQYADESKTVPKPSYWGGYKVIPQKIEFWQGQTNRLHDRILFRRKIDEETIDPETTHVGEDGWVYERLSP